MVTERPQLRKWHGAGHVAEPAERVVLVGADPEDGGHRDWLQYDFGQVVAQMMLCAVDLGIGSGHSAAADQQNTREVLGLPQRYFCAHLVAFGAPTRPGLAPARRPGRRPGRRFGRCPFDEVAHWDRWWASVHGCWLAGERAE